MELRLSVLGYLVKETELARSAPADSVIDLFCRCERRLAQLSQLRGNAGKYPL